MEKNELVQKIYSKIEELPTLPVVIPRLLKLLEDKNSDASGVTGLISSDPALTAKILKVANSAYYGFSHKISELELAVTLLGFNMVKSLALSIGVIKTFPEGNESQYFSHDGLWLHSLSVATIMNEIGRKYIKKNLNESLFVIGLLHDTGKLVFDQFFHDEFQKVLKYANEHENVKLHRAEFELIGIDHCELAGILIDRWNFPENIRYPIQYHHYHDIPEEASKVDIALLRLSNVLSQEMDTGIEGNPNPNPIYDEDLKSLNLDNNELETIRNSLGDINVKVQDFFRSIK